MIKEKTELMIKSHFFIFIAKENIKTESIGR